MNGEDSFETRLRQQPQRQIPASWRREILAAARPPGKSRPSLFARLIWPNPYAWGALAAAWLLMLGMSFVSRDTSALPTSREIAKPSPQLREMWLQQERLLAELAAPGEESSSQPPRKPAVVPPQPRSQRREDFAIV